jgi:hypothetical protein
VRIEPYLHLVKGKPEERVQQRRKKKPVLKERQKERKKLPRGAPGEKRRRIRQRTQGEEGTKKNIDIYRG